MANHTSSEICQREHIDSQQDFDVSLYLCPFHACACAFVSSSYSYVYAWLGTEHTSWPWGSYEEWCCNLHRSLGLIPLAYNRCKIRQFGATVWHGRLECCYYSLQYQSNGQIFGLTHPHVSRNNQHWPELPPSPSAKYKIMTDGTPISKSNIYPLEYLCKLATIWMVTLSCCSSTRSITL